MSKIRNTKRVSDAAPGRGDLNQIVGDIVNEAMRKPLVVLDDIMAFRQYASRD